MLHRVRIGKVGNLAKKGFPGELDRGGIDNVVSSRGLGKIYQNVLQQCFNMLLKNVTFNIVLRLMLWYV